MEEIFGDSISRKMYLDHTIAVIVPAYNEEKLIKRTLSTMPEFVDRIIVVDDHSRDFTSTIVKNLALHDCRITLIQHNTNQGVGAAISTGYAQVLKEDMDITAVMAGDNQMDPNDLETILQPIIDGCADYVKGNRFVIPVIRYFGGLVLGWLTSLATGYKIKDSQTGYTAITKDILRRLPLDEIYPSYGMPNDLLIKLAAIHPQPQIEQVNINPIYGNGAVSGIRISKVILPILGILRRGIWQRILR